MCDGKEEKERISRWFSLRSVDPCQGVTPGVMKVSQISPARSSCGETEYVSTPCTSLFLVSASARKLMRAVWVTMRTCQKWQRSQRQGGLWRLETDSWFATFGLTDCGVNDHYLWKCVRGVNKGRAGVCTGQLLDIGPGQNNTETIIFNRLNAGS